MLPSVDKIPENAVKKHIQEYYAIINSCSQPVGKIFF